MPTLFVNAADEDTGNAAQAAALMPQARAALIPRAGHVGAVLRSKLVLPQARAFVRAVLPMAPS